MLRLKARVFDRFVNRFKVPKLIESQRQLIAWLETPLGQCIYTCERQVGSREAFNVGGYRAAQMGISSGHSLIDGLQHEHKFILAPSVDSYAACVCDFQSLPLPSNTLDAICLHHALDFSPGPHKLLNEAARAISAGGYIIVVAFNPFSVFGLTKWVAGLTTRQQVWRHNSLRRARIIDWLQLIGFQVIATEQGGLGNTTNLPRASSGVRLVDWARKRISVGAFYVVVARKQVTPLNPIRNAAWQTGKIPALAGLKSMDFENNNL